MFDGARRGEAFGNARYARTIFELALNAQALRLEEGANGELGTLPVDELVQVTVSDVLAAARALGEEPARRSGWFRRRP